MATDVLGLLVRLMSDMGREVADAIGDPLTRDELLQRAGRATPAGPPPSSQQASSVFETLNAKAQAGAGSDDADTLQLLFELSEAMAVLVSFLQQAAELDPDDPDDWWNLAATLLDWIALARLKTKNPTALALLTALHLISDDRLLIAELIRAIGNAFQGEAGLGDVLLGHPAGEGDDSDDARADSASIIIGAAFAVLGLLVPFEDDAGEQWSTDMLFGWDSEPSLDHPRATRVLQRMGTFTLTHRDGPLEERAGLSVVVVPPSDGGWGLFFALDLGAKLALPVGEHLELVLEADVPAAIEVFTGSDIVPSFFQPSAAATSARVALRRKAELAESWVIGGADTFHLKMRTFSLGVEFGDPTSFRLAIGDGALVLPQSSLGVLGALLPSGGATLKFDLAVIVDSNGEVSFEGGAGMTVTTPVNVSIAGLTVRGVTVAFEISGSDGGAGGQGAGTLSAVAAMSLSLGGALGVSVDRIGAKLVWALPPPADPAAPAPVPGNLGPYGDIGVDFVAPLGIAITVNIGSLKGGGFLFLDEPRSIYGGALEMKLTLCEVDLQVKAAGVLRETDTGWSLVVIISAQFPEPVELGGGMLLTGVGGMAGLNVGIDLVALRAGLHDGTVGRLLFPDDPVASAPAIIEAMRVVFPARDGGLVAGPLVQLGWGRPKPFVTLSAAIVLARPSPTLIAILGRLRVTAPDPELPLVDIKADFLGVISFEEPSVAFDAALVDSHIAGYNLTGDLALRLGPPGFILAVGGVHPRFTPPASVPALRRVTLDISPSSSTKIKAEAYLAITSNTFQIGLHARLDIDAGPASIHGWLDFDALVAWDPHFYMSMALEIGLELRIGGRTIAGVEVDLLLEGPGPWHAKGRASISFFFFTLHAGFEKTWGEVDPGVRPPELDATSVVVQALSAPGAWTQVAPRGDAVVTLREVQRETVGVHPYGQLSVRQQVLPLGVPIARIGRSRVAGGSATVVVTPIAGTPASRPTTGRFAVAEFQDLSDDEKLARPSFEPLQDGIAFGAERTIVSAEQFVTAAYETVFVPDDERHGGGVVDRAIFLHALQLGAIGRSERHRARLHDGVDQRVRVVGSRFEVVAADTLVAVATTGAFGSATEAHAAAADGGGRVLVVAAHEGVR